MASDPQRKKLVAEISELQDLQIKSIAAATFGGWTGEQVATLDKRAERLTLLIRELEALDLRGSCER